MRAVRSTNTSPEIRVRRIAHKLGYRFRLHRPDLPGKPDLAFPGKRKAVFVNGCFWHQHQGCRRATVPQTNTDFWNKKLAGNVARDLAQVLALRKLGWKLLVIWECETKSESVLAGHLKRFLALCREIGTWVELPAPYVFSVPVNVRKEP